MPLAALCQQRVQPYLCLLFSPPPQPLPLGVAGERASAKGRHHIQSLLPTAL